MNSPIALMGMALAAEVLLLLFALLTWSWLANRGARRRDAKAIRTLIGRIKKAKAEREAEIERFLVERMQLGEAPLQQAKVAMLRAELVLLQRFAGIYKKREAAAAARFDADLSAALQPYHALQASVAPLQGEAEAIDQAELAALRNENARLSEELTLTMETMSRMLNEYSSMFAGGSRSDAPPIAALVGGGAAGNAQPDTVAAEGPVVADSAVTETTASERSEVASVETAGDDALGEEAASVALVDDPRIDLPADADAGAAAGGDEADGEFDIEVAVVGDREFDPAAGEEQASAGRPAAPEMDELFDDLEPSLTSHNKP